MHSKTGGLLSVESVRLSMAEAKVQAYGHYAALHATPGGERFGRTHRAGGCAVSTSVAHNLLRLPLYPDMTMEAVEIVVQALGTALGDSPGTLYARPVPGAAVG